MGGYRAMKHFGSVNSLSVVVIKGDLGLVGALERF